jgi:hypothetical protein
MKAFLLTHGDFIDGLDFTEAVITTALPLRSVDSACVEFWGATIVTGHALDMSHDAYVAGYGRISFYGVTDQSISIALYDPSGSTLLKDKDGNQVVIQDRSYLSRRAAEFAYGFNSVIAWPYGFCDLRIQASAEFRLEFDPSTAIPVANYTLEAKRYAWPGGKWESPWSKLLL